MWHSLFSLCLTGRKEYRGRNTDQGDEGNFAASRAKVARQVKRRPFRAAEKNSKKSGL
jgi:hypothetical protein